MLISTSLLKTNTVTTLFYSWFGKTMFKASPQRKKNFKIWMGNFDPFCSEPPVSQYNRLNAFMLRRTLISLKHSSEVEGILWCSCCVRVCPTLNITHYDQEWQLFWKKNPTLLNSVDWSIELFRMYSMIFWEKWHCISHFTTSRSVNFRKFIC